MSSDVDSLEQAFEETRELFVAFGDKYRQDIIVLLSSGQRMTVQELSEALTLSRPATSHHIKLLKHAGLLGEHKEGVRRYYYPTLRAGFVKVKQLMDAAEGWVKE